MRSPTDTSLTTAPDPESAATTLEDVIRAGVAALDLPADQAELLEGIVVGGEVYDLSDRAEIIEPVTLNGDIIR